MGGINSIEMWVDVKLILQHNIIRSVCCLQLYSFVCMMYMYNGSLALCDMHLHPCRILIQVMGVYIAEISPKHLRGKLVTLVTIIGASSNFVRAAVVKL